MELLRNFPLAGLTSIRVGGVARYYAEPSNFEEVGELVKLSTDKDMSIFLLGGGSNTVFGDVKGLVLSLKGLRGLRVEPGNGTFHIEAFAGTPLKELVSLAVKENLEGIYKLVGFPATVGGAVAMNAGAFGVEISDFLREVTYVDWEGRIHRVGADRLKFSYRASPFPELGVVVACSFAFRRSKEDVSEDFMAVRGERKKKQPIDKPTSGSTFKNPYPMYAGELLEKVALKGFRHGDVMFSEKHANFMVNLGNGRFEDVLAIIGEAKRRVFEEFGVSLEEEVKLVEDSGSDGWKVL